MRLAILADTHYNSSKQTNCGGARHTGIADKLVRQAVALINETIKPDITILWEIWRMRHPNDLRFLKCWTTWTQKSSRSRNHDGAPDQFYSIFPKPDPIVEIGETRFVFMWMRNDRATMPGVRPKTTARTTSQKQLARRYRFPQHVPVFPPGQSTCPYHYVNIEDIMASLEESKTTLVISAHFHPGIPPSVPQPGHLYGGASPVRRQLPRDRCGHFKRKC